MSGRLTPRHHRRWRDRIRLRPGFILLAFTVTFAAGWLAAPPATQAGLYQLRNCLPNAAVKFDAAWEAYGAARLHATLTCNQRAGGVAALYQSRDGVAFRDGEGGAYRWSAPPGAAFIASDMRGRLRNANGIAAQVYTVDPGGGFHSIDAATLHDGSWRRMIVSFQPVQGRSVAARLACFNQPPCSNRPGDTRAFFELEDIDLTLQDTTPPSVSTGGELFTRPSGQLTFRGRVGFSAQAADNGGGVWQLYAEINGNRRTLTSPHCPGDRGGYSDRTRPCARQASWSGSLDTTGSPFREGQNTVRVCARDYANGSVGSSSGPNTTCSGTRTITVDNLAPGAPQGISVVGGSEWRPENGFDLHWHNPSDESTTVVAARLRIGNVAGELALPESETGGANIESLTGIQVPGPGQYWAGVRLRDSAGNLGPSAGVVLSFDDLRPTEVAPQPPPGWLSARDFPYRQEIEPAHSAGPSGINGYAVTVNEAEPEIPCLTGRCLPDQVTLKGGRENRLLTLSELSQGSHWVSTAAVSGAGLRSAQERSTRLRVDLTDPTTVAAGVPEGWSRRPVTVTVRASDAESGMQPAPGYDSGSPQVVIAPDAGDPQVTPGAQASLNLNGDGEHRLRYWAQDLAGNANDGRRLANGHLHDPPGEVTVRIDSTPPRVEFRAPDRVSPELIRARAEDPVSGVASGRILLRPAGSTEPFTELTTRLEGGTLSAHFPSDLLPDGPYEFRAEARDRAGNTAEGALRTDGTAMVLTNPVKPVTRLGLRFTGRGKPTRRLLRHGRRATVTGRVLDGDGEPVTGAAVALSEIFDRGASASGRRRQVVTDRQGNFTATLRPGPSRRVRAEFAGSKLLARGKSRPLRIVARSRTALRLSPQVAVNRQPVLMRGRVAGRGAQTPPGGKTVAIQYLDPERGRWRPVEVLRTDRRGRFRYRYRFRTIATAQRVVFRAVALPEAGWPYRPSTSTASPVIVYPR